MVKIIIIPGGKRMAGDGKRITTTTRISSSKRMRMLVMEKEVGGRQ